jgi:hypothetical protein
MVATPQGLSPLCVDRAVPMRGKPEDGHASDKTRNTTLLSAIAPLLAQVMLQICTFPACVPCC